MNPFVIKAGEAAPVSRPAKRLHQGTAQQEALWQELASDSNRNVLVEARAGSGKSASCREGMWRMIERRPDLAGSIRYAVFSKQNADEFREDCPRGVEVGTVHSFGYAVLQKRLGSRLEKNKTYLLLDETREGRSLPRYIRRSLAMLVSSAKNQALVPESEGLTGQLEQLLVHYDINAWGRARWLAGEAAELLKKSVQWNEVVDFDDMIWLPGILQLPFPACEALFLDEVQDWNPAQHALIELLCQSGRTIAVGDRWQSIYAFRGADIDSIPRLEARLAARPGGLAQMPLTITWRCPSQHVSLAQQFVPDLLAHPEAIRGHVGTMAEDTAQKGYASGDMVLCATNAPLIRCALRLISESRRALVRGRAVGDQLLAVVRSAGEARTVSEMAKRVSDWESRELLRLSDLEGVEDLVEGVKDRAAGVQAVLATVDSPAQLEGAIEALFSDTADSRRTPTSVIFSTIHRAKGLEADRVWLLDAPLREPKRSWEIQQQQNLHYVSLTRSKETLNFVE